MLCPQCQGFEVNDTSHNQQKFGFCPKCQVICVEFGPDSPEAYRQIVVRKHPRPLFHRPPVEESTPVMEQTLSEISAVTRNIQHQRAALEQQVAEQATPWKERFRAYREESSPALRRWEA
jgi:Zn-finger nucleic acid-binding protein